MKPKPALCLSCLIALISKRFHVCAYALVFLFFVPACGGGSGQEDEARYFENARAVRTESGTYWVLELAGTWQEMGRQYGSLMGPELRRFHDELTTDLLDRGMSEEELATTWDDIQELYSWQLQDLLLGISQTSGLSLEQTLTLNFGMMYLAQTVLGGEPPSACSGIAVWGGYTRDKNLIFGRNWDISREAMSRYMRYLAVVVFHPEQGYPVANIHPLGNVYLETGMNSHGVFIELNNGEYSDPTYYEDREDTTSVLVRVLNQSKNVEEAVDMLMNSPADISYILQIADETHAVSLERPTFDARVRPPDDEGLVIAYNSFVPPYPAHWEDKVKPPKPVEDDPRYENMLTLAQSPAYKGQFTPWSMQQYLEVPVEEGGAYHGGTVLQVVAVPAERTIWMRGCDYSDWEKVPLDGYFDGRQQ